MKIGYPCRNSSTPTSPNVKSRLASYAPKLFRKTLVGNLATLQESFEDNLKHGLKFFRISSDTVPFASHSVCKIDWAKEFKSELKALGHVIIENDMRISMHPDTCVVINSSDEKAAENSLAELKYHADFLDAMELDRTAKIQIRAGGAYGNKIAVMSSLIHAVLKLPEHVRRRLVIENDDKCFCLLDCTVIAQKTGLPIGFNSFYHACLSRGEPLAEAMRQVSSTWNKEDGIPTVNYSSQQPGATKGTHTDSIDMIDFEKFLKETARFNFDVMLEINDKTKSVAKALEAIGRCRG